MTVIVESQNQGSSIHKAYVDTMMFYVQKCNIPTAIAEAYGAKAIYLYTKELYAESAQYYLQRLKSLVHFLLFQLYEVLV